MFKKILAYILLATMLAGGSTMAAEETTATATAAPTATATATATPAASAAATATATPAADTTVSTEANSEKEITFPDVDENSINAGAIIALAKMNVINGYEDGTFRPENAVSRAEFVKMLVVLAGWEKITYQDGDITGFSDVDSKNHWATHYIKTVTSNKIVNGYEDGTFRPDNTVTLEEAVKMIVCYLGREDEAKYKAEQNGVPLWPNGYMIVATDLSITQLISCKQGENINRAQVAQLIYNSKDLTRKLGISSGAYIAPVTSGTGSSGSGGGGGGGGTASDKGQNVYGKQVTGTIVAVKYKSGSKRFIYQLEDNIVIHGSKLTTLGESQFVLKVDSKIDGDEQYVIFESGSGTNYSSMLGRHVAVKYNYDLDNKVNFVSTSVTNYDDMEIIELSSENILYDRTVRENESNEEKRIYYEDSKGKTKYAKIPDNLEEVDSIYNERLMRGVSPDESETPDESENTEGSETPEGGENLEGNEIKEESETPEEEGTPEENENPEITAKLEFDDLLPEEGTVILTYKSGNLIFVNVESYETFVVGKINASTPQYIEDKFRKDENGEPVRLYIDDSENSDVELDISVENSSTDDATFRSITQKSALKVAKSKDGSYLNIYIYNKSSAAKSGTLSSISDDSYRFSGNSTDYEFTDYFTDYVKQKLSGLEIGDRITYYLDITKSKILWAEKSETAYSFGYLVKAIDGSDDNEPHLTLKIFSTSNKFTELKVKKNAKVDGVKLGGFKEIYDELLKNAEEINKDKPSYLLNGAEANQPIRYVASNSEISDIELVKIDSTNRFTGTSREFKKTTVYTMGDFEVRKNSDSYTVFVPNDRKGSTNEKQFKIIKNTETELDNRFKKGLSYDIEPFFVKDKEGEYVRRVYVVYNQRNDAQANFHSKNAVIKKCEETTNEYRLDTYLTDSGTTKKYLTSNKQDKQKAYVLDENFEHRTDDRREVEEGDVIRSGVCTDDNYITNLEIIYDVENGEESPVKNLKTVVYNKSGKRLTVADVDEDTYYYLAVGVVSSLNHNESYCAITTCENGKTKNVKVDSDAYSTKSVLMYDLTADKPSVKTAKLTDVSVGDMIIFNRTTDFKYNFIYVVRYKDWNLLDELQKLKDGTVTLNEENSTMETFMSEAALEFDEKNENSLDELFGTDVSENVSNLTEEEEYPMQESEENIPNEETETEKAIISEESNEETYSETETADEEISETDN